MGFRKSEKMRFIVCVALSLCWPIALHFSREEGAETIELANCPTFLREEEEKTAHFSIIFISLNINFLRLKMSECDRVFSILNLLII